MVSKTSSQQPSWDKIGLVIPEFVVKMLDQWPQVLDTLESSRLSGKKMCS